MVGIEPLRLLCVLTREEDEPGEGAATLARYAAAGHEVMVVICTGEGDRGEAAAVMELLGAGRHWLGFPVSGRGLGGGPVPPGRFASVPVEVPTERLVLVLREFRPHVVVVHVDTTDPDPDRIRCREVSAAAFDAAAAPDRFPHAGEPWRTPKLYHVHEWSEPRTRALHKALCAEGLESPYHQWLGSPADDTRITTRVPCGEYFPVREQLLRAHANRLAPDRHWFAVPVRVRQLVWPTEDFELVRCHVSTVLPEDDLFAGVSQARH